MSVTLVCVADTHMFHADFKDVPAGDVFVHAGDLGRAGDEEELVEAARWLRSLPHHHKVVVPGNHDFLFQTQPARAREIFAGLTVLIDEAAVIGGLRFWGSPWTPEFYDWAFMLERGPALAEKWALIPADTDVLITHGPPRGILDDAGGYRRATPLHELLTALGEKDPVPVGCDDLLARVQAVQPRVHLFGHIHNNQGVVDDGNTRFVNCTTNESELAPVVVTI